MNKQEKILFIQLFSNGDCLYATTVARQIKQDYPGCYLIWVIADYCKSIIANNPYVDEVLLIENINYKNWKQHWKSFQQQITEVKQQKGIDKVFFTQIIDSNFANYDYCIRSSIFHGYNGQITVPLQPVLKLTEDEKIKVENFVFEHRLSSYKHIILLEFSPRSGQSKFSLETALNIAEKLIKNNSAIFIFSSATKLDTNSSSIIDASSLTLREIAYLSRHCTLLIGCSSGTTWITTSDAGKQLPMVQILDPKSYWFNSVANDHKRFGLPVDHIIELGDSDDEIIFQCVNAIIQKDFGIARASFHREWQQQFRITRGIISYFLGKGDIKSAIKHIRININLFGFKRGLLKSIFLGITTFPVVNYFNKRKEKALEKA